MKLKDISFEAKGIKIMYGDTEIMKKGLLQEQWGRCCGEIPGTRHISRMQKPYARVIVATH